MAVFLASADSAYITGQVLTVDGGLSLGAVGRFVIECAQLQAASAINSCGTDSSLFLWRTVAMPTQEEIYTKVSATWSRR